MAALWLAGGASRADVLGQVVVRAAAWALLIVGVLFADRPVIGPARPVALLLGAMVGLAIAQLVPLPPAVWQMLPGRAVLMGAAAEQPWRPWTMTPSATWNALSSLIVPVSTLFLVLGLRREESRWLAPLLLALAALQALVGLLQFSGGGDVSGMFANRNHLALFLTFGILLAPAWAVADHRRSGWRGPFAAGLMLILVLMLLAVGSRAGLLLGAIALALGLLAIFPRLRNRPGRHPRWLLPALVAAAVGGVALIGAVSVLAGRAETISRFLTLDAGQDLRRRTLPVVWEIVRTYFPWGYGVGGFDPIFRLHEPMSLLKPTFFNHAHDDYLEVLADSGAAGLLLLVAGCAWWGLASVRAWRGGAEPADVPPRLGSAMLLLIGIASIFDYPARTPLVMASAVLAAVWLSRRISSGKDIRTARSL